MLRFPARKKRFSSSPQSPYRLWDPPSLLSESKPGVKWPGREANNSYPSTSDVKNRVTNFALVSCLSYSLTLNMEANCFVPKRRLTFHGLHAVIPKKTELFITIAVRY
jgi:hypothetical protein